jgi:hypothetical protein
VETGEYLVIQAERGGHRHAIGLLYTSATDNAVYKQLVSASWELEVQTK